jgi:hypothetical protein
MTNNEIKQPLPMPIEKIHRMFCVPRAHLGCDHEWGGWRNFEDGNGGEQVCKLCGMGAMSHSLRFGP